MDPLKNPGGESLLPAFLAAGMTLLLWSGTAIANKFAVMHIDALTAGVLRSMIAGFLALAIAVVTRLPFPGSGRDRWLLILSGFTSFALWPMLLSLGVGRTTAGHAGLIMAMIPVLTVLIAAAVRRRAPALLWWVGAGIALTSTAVLIAYRDPSGTAAGSTGDLLVLAGSLCCASGYVAGGKLSPRIGPVATTFWSLSLALLVLVPSFALLYDCTDWSAVAPASWLGIAWMAFLSSFAGYALWFFAMSRAGIERISTLQLLMPAVTLLGATWLLSESLGLFLVLISAGVISGTWLAQRHAA